LTTLYKVKAYQLVLRSRLDGLANSRLHVSDNVVVLGPDGLVELTVSGESTEGGGSDKDIRQGDTVTDQVGLVLEVLVQEIELLLNLGEDRGEGLATKMPAIRSAQNVDKNQRRHTHGLGVSQTSSNHSHQVALGNGDLLVGESGPLGDPGSGSLVVGEEVSRGSGQSSYA
jgi:hypothetical protein